MPSTSLVNSLLANFAEDGRERGPTQGFGMTETIRAVKGFANRCSLSAALLGFLAFGLFGCFERGWPPELGEPYPAINMINYDGREFRVADFEGRVVLLGLVSMDSPVSNAYAGGGYKGGLGGVMPQPGLGSLDDYLQKHAGGLTPDYSDLVVVHLLIYDEDRSAPNVDDAKRWAEHFDLSGRQNVYVAVARRDLRSQASAAMTPGFQLVDKNAILRADSTGFEPRHDLFGELLPEIPNLMRESVLAARAAKARPQLVRAVPIEELREQ